MIPFSKAEKKKRPRYYYLRFILILLEVLHSTLNEFHLISLLKKLFVFSNPMDVWRPTLNWYVNTITIFFSFLFISE
jgi:hypothetical protein